MSPDAWFCPATPLRPLRCRQSSPAEGSSFSSTPWPPPLGWPSSSFLPSLGGGGELPCSSSSFSREEGVADSSDDGLDTTVLRELFRVSVVFFFLTFFSGTT